MQHDTGSRRTAYNSAGQRFTAVRGANLHGFTTSHYYDGAGRLTAMHNNPPGVEGKMTEQAALNFIESFYGDIITAMQDADKDDIDPQYRLGVRRLAWAFFNKFELFDIESMIPGLSKHDVDAWFAGCENR